MSTRTGPFILSLSAALCCSAPLSAQIIEPQDLPDVEVPTPDVELEDDPEDVPDPEVPSEELVDEAASQGGELIVPATSEEATSEEASPKPETDKKIWEVDELIESAYRNAASLRVEEANQRHADWQAFRAKYAWTPKIQADTLLAPVPANTDPNDLANNLDEISSFNIGPFVRQTVNLVVPLYTFGRIRTARELAEVGKKNAALEEQKARRELEYQVRQAYYGLRIARALDAMIADGSVLVAEQLEKMEDARDFGDAEFDIKDFRKLQIFQTDLETRALDNQKIIALATAGLKYLTDQDVGIDQVADLDVDSEPLELESYDRYAAIAERQRPEVQQLEQAVEARRLQVALERSAFYPNFFFGANFTFGYSTERIANQRIFRKEGPSEELIETDLVAAPFANPYDQLSIGATLGLRWTFDFAQNYGSLKEAKARQEQTLAQRAQAIGAIELEIRKLHLEAEQARERIAIQARRLEAARRWRDQLGLSIESAGADVSDALEPLKAYYEAKVLHMQAVFDYELARAALARGLGLSQLPEVSAAASPDPLPGPRRE